MFFVVFFCFSESSFFYVIAVLFKDILMRFQILNILQKGCVLRLEFSFLSIERHWVLSPNRLEVQEFKSNCCGKA